MISRGQHWAATWLFVLVAAVHAPAGAGAQVLEVTAATLDAHQDLIEGWRFHPGDDPGWADPALDDSAWRPINPQLPVSNLPDDWHGIGWFRLHLRPSAGLAGELIGYEITQEGASEVFLDGRRLANQGTVGASRETEQAYWFPDPARPLHLAPDPEGGVHVLAVRYSNHARHAKLGGEGFWFSLHRLEESHARHRAKLLDKTQEAMFLAGSGAAFAVLHLMLYIFFPRVRANLYYALFATCIAGVYWSDQRSIFGHDPAVVTFWFKWMVTWGTLLPIAGVLVVHSAFRSRIPVHIYPLAAAAAGVIAWCWLTPGWISDIKPVFAFSAVPYLETLRVLGLAIYRRQSRAWVIGLGFTCFVLTAFSPILGVGFDARILVSAGLLMLLISISVYLAMGVAQTEHDLAARLADVERLNLENLEQERETQRIETERKLLEADNRRQADELEAARQLQLSMLPASAPEHPDVDVAFRMWTATEVGGDYYDYRTGDDGVLTLAIGDATGHGLDAGLVVVAAKSVFQTPTGDDRPSALLERISGGIRGLRLERMNMAMSVVRIDGRTLTLAAAGMPPALLYHATTREIQELLLPGPPLGTFAGFAYRESVHELEPGDALLLMSDGLPELQNTEDEMLGYERTRRLFDGVATEKPETVIERIHQASQDFAGERPLEDDLTLLALRVR